MPFVSDAVSVSELGAAGWTCAANEIENMDCNRPMDVEGVGAAQISVMPTPAGQVSLINLTASQPALTPASSVLLGDTLAALAASHGWSCEPSSELGTMRPCTKDGATIQIELFPNQGYAMASVRAPGLEGQMND